MEIYLFSDRPRIRRMQEGKNRSSKYDFGYFQSAICCSGLSKMIRRFQKIVQIFGKRVSNRSDGSVTRPWLRSRLAWSKNRSFDNLFSFVATSINRCTDYKKTTNMKRLDTRYGVIFADLTADMGHWI